MNEELKDPAPPALSYNDRLTAIIREPNSPPALIMLLSHWPEAGEQVPATMIKNVHASFAVTIAESAVDHAIELIPGERDAASN